MVLTCICFWGKARSCTQTSSIGKRGSLHSWVVYSQVFCAAYLVGLLCKLLCQWDSVVLVLFVHCCWPWALGLTLVFVFFLHSWIVTLSISLACACPFCWKGLVYFFNSHSPLDSVKDGPCNCAVFLVKCG